MYRDFRVDMLFRMEREGKSGLIPIALKLTICVISGPEEKVWLSSIRRTAHGTDLYFSRSIATSVWEDM